MSFREMSFKWFNLSRCEACEALCERDDMHGYRIYPESEIEGYVCGRC
jgi:hypothetical protein